MHRDIAANGSEAPKVWKFPQKTRWMSKDPLAQRYKDSFRAFAVHVRQA